MLEIQQGGTYEAFGNDSVPWGLTITNSSWRCLPMLTPIIMLALESQGVIALRTMKFLSGDADSFSEAQLMVKEKLEAAVEASISIIGGSTTDSVINRYRELVAANAVRLR